MCIRDSARRAAQKDREEEESLATLQKELRGKDYGNDHGGKVAVFSRVDPDKLPAQSVGAQVAVRGEAAAGGPADAMAAAPMKPKRALSMRSQLAAQLANRRAAQESNDSMGEFGD